MKSLYILIVLLLFAEYGFAQNPHTVYMVNDTVLATAASARFDCSLSDPERKLEAGKTVIFKAVNVNPFVYNVSIDGTQDFITYPQGKDSLLPIAFSPFSITDLTQNISMFAASGDSLPTPVQLLENQYNELLDLAAKLNGLEAVKVRIQIAAELNDNFQSRKNAVHSILASYPLSLPATSMDNPDSIYSNMWRIYVAYTNQLELVRRTASDLKVNAGGPSGKNTGDKTPTPKEIKEQEKNKATKKTTPASNPDTTSPSNDAGSEIDSFIELLNAQAERVNDSALKNLFTEITMLASQVETTSNMVYSPPVVPKGDELTVNVSIAPRTNLVYRKYNLLQPQSFSLSYWVKNKRSASISAGLGFTPMADDHYSIQSNTFNDTTFKLNPVLGYTDTISSIQKVSRYKLVKQSGKGMNAGITLMTNFTWRLGYNFSFGGGFGTFFDGDKRMRYIMGFSFVIGHHNRLIVNAGAIYGKVGKLQEGYDEQTYYTQNFSDGTPYRFVPKWNYFVAISYNFNFSKISIPWAEKNNPDENAGDSKKEK